jgi:hypothetical protein
MSLESVAKPLKDSLRWRIAKPLFGVTLEFVEVSVGAGARLRAAATVASIENESPVRSASVGFAETDIHAGWEPSAVPA